LSIIQMKMLIKFVDLRRQGAGGEK
jgi:hypothetical protein